MSIFVEQKFQLTGADVVALVNYGYNMLRADFFKPLDQHPSVIQILDGKRRKSRFLRLTGCGERRAAIAVPIDHVSHLERDPRGTKVLLIGDLDGILVIEDFEYILEQLEE